VNSAQNFANEIHSYLFQTSKFQFSSVFEIENVTNSMGRSIVKELPQRFEIKFDVSRRWKVFLGNERKLSDVSVFQLQNLTVNGIQI